MSRSTAAITALLLLSIPTAARAQDAEFERLLSSASSSWGSGDADSIARLGTRDGLFIKIGSRSFGPLGARHASAVLRDLFQRLGTAELRQRSARRVGGDRPRGYGEFVWLTENARQPTVFLGFVRGDDGWRLTEIRVNVPGW